jgi:hypothetical protein
MSGAKIPGHACRMWIYTRGFGLKSSFAVGTLVCYCCRLLSSNDSYPALYCHAFTLEYISYPHYETKTEELREKFLACERSMMTSN